MLGGPAGTRTGVSEKAEGGIDSIRGCDGGNEGIGTGGSPRITAAVATSASSVRAASSLGGLVLCDAAGRGRSLCSSGISSRVSSSTGGVVDGSGPRLACSRASVSCSSPRPGSSGAMRPQACSSDRIASGRSPCSSSICPRASHAAPYPGSSRVARFSSASALTSWPAPWSTSANFTQDGASCAVSPPRPRMMRRLSRASIQGEAAGESLRMRSRTGSSGKQGSPSGRTSWIREASSSPLPGSFQSPPRRRRKVSPT
jgi:hypothetical protein